jgi:surface antigen
MWYKRLNIPLLKWNFMHIKQLSALLLLSFLIACANPTAEQSASSWVGVAPATKNIGTNPCAFMMTHFKLDKRDCLMIQKTIQHALEYAPDGQVSIWKNPSSGNAGTILVKATTLENQSPLRKYKMSVQTARGTQTLEGVGRRHLDGTWLLSKD